jgi:hypothetical protein
MSVVGDVVVIHECLIAFGVCAMAKPDKLYCSRFSRTKDDAIRIASMLRSIGGKCVVITGQKGAWRVRGKVDVAKFARFCANEAKDETNR